MRTRTYAGESCLSAPLYPRLQAHVRTCWREAESCWVPPSWCCARRQNRGIHGYLASSPRRVRRELSRQRSDLLVAGDEHASRCVRWDRLRVQRGDEIAGRGTQPSERNQPIVMTTVVMTLLDCAAAVANRENVHGGSCCTQATCCGPMIRVRTAAAAITDDFAP